jgi:hypothetical protein
MDRRRVDLEWRMVLGGWPLGLSAVSARRLGSRLLDSRATWLAQSTGTLALKQIYHSTTTETYLLRVSLKYIWRSSADVAELADALDSKFQFHHFQRASPRFNKIVNPIDFTA